MWQTLRNWILKYRRGVVQKYRMVFSSVIGKTVLVLVVVTEGRGQIAMLTVHLVSSLSPFLFPSLGAAGPESGAPVIKWMGDRMEMESRITDIRIT